MEHGDPRCKNEKIILYPGDSFNRVTTQSFAPFDLNTQSIKDGDYKHKAITSGRQSSAEVKISGGNLFLNTKLKYIPSIIGLVNSY